MTCLERFKLEHDISDDDEIVMHYCPDLCGYVVGKYENCELYEGRNINLCRECWNWEADEEKFNVLEKLEPPPSNPDQPAPAVYEPKLTSKDSDHSVQGLVYGIAEAVNPELMKKIEDLSDAMDVYKSASEPTATGTIKDSGDRTEFASGAVRDMREGKGRCDLMPLDVCSDFLYYLCDGVSTMARYKQGLVLGHIYSFTLNGEPRCLYQALIAAEPFENPETMFLEVAKHFEEGAKKYGENNWQKGIPVKCYIDSAVRHYLKYLRGDKDEPHDRAFVWNILCCIWTCKHHPELNDYLMKEGSEG